MTTAGLEYFIFQNIYISQEVWTRKSRGKGQVFLLQLIWGPMNNTFSPETDWDNSLKRTSQTSYKDTKWEEKYFLMSQCNYCNEGFLTKKIQAVQSTSLSFEVSHLINCLNPQSVSRHYIQEQFLTRVCFSFQTDVKKVNISLQLLPAFLPRGKMKKQLATVQSAMQSFIDVQPVSSTLRNLRCQAKFSKRYGMICPLW